MTENEEPLRVVIGVREGRVIVDLGEDVSWFAMPPSQARQMADSLINAAVHLEKDQK